MTSDEQLLRLAATGDRSAFETIVERHGAAVLRFAGTLTKNPAAAEDVFQETLLAVWRNATTFEASGSARGWLLTIARNAALRQFRRRADEPSRHDPLDVLGTKAGWGAVDADFAKHLENRQLLQRGLEALSVEEREVLVLRELEGCSGEEVAAVLGISLAAMKSRLHRARLRLVAELRGRMDD